VETATTDSAQPDLARQELASALKQAITREDFVALYQPIIALSSGRPTHLEALIRWNRPGVQLLTPDQFIRVAEEASVIGEIGAWMLKRAVRDCVAWQDYAPGVGVSVNVSPRQFDDGTFVDLIQSVICDERLPPELLTIEISEHALSEWRHPMLEALITIRQLGIKMSLDDVGTSDGSLRVLSILPLSELKIDVSLIATLDAPHAHLRLIGLILETARFLGLGAVAEGIDSATKLHAIQQLGCRYGQGNLFAEPARFNRVIQDLQGIPSR
jgi:EAL domain-containing protein (putative c-di-GMP-specific phosphodiesterase class I)